MSTRKRAATVPSRTPDARLDRIEAAFLAIPDVCRRLTDAIARAVDEIVDPIRSGRWQVAQLDQPEKTVIGIRVENILRIELELPRATHLDLEIAGENVDVKFTIRDNWAIPPEAIDEVCLVTRFRPTDNAIWAGLLRTTRQHLHPGKGNRDSKRGVNKDGKNAIRWLVKGATSSTSMIGFMGSLAPGVRTSLTDPGVGAQIRLNRLFTAVKHQPIPESVVEAIAQHSDWTRRLRPDATNRKAPGAQIGFDVLRQSSHIDRNTLASAGHLPLAPGFCISVNA